jgi:hypothetical protein
MAQKTNQSMALQILGTHVRAEGFLGGCVFMTIRGTAWIS